MCGYSTWGATIHVLLARVSQCTGMASDVLMDSEYDTFAMLKTLLLLIQRHQTRPFWSK